MSRSAILDPADTAVATGLPYVLDTQVGFLLRQAQQRHTAIFAAAFGEDMTPVQWATLARLASEGECSQNRLGRLVGTDVATIKGVVERLRRRGFVETAADAGDKRRVLLRPSAAGRAAYRDMLARALAVSRATLEPLDPAEQATFLALLDRLR